MELRHIRYFVAAAEEQHFGRAAEILSVTRPAVSQTIADLEVELGVLLFDRVAQKVTLSLAGETFLKHARSLLSELAVAVQTTKRVGQGKLGVMTIGYGSLGLRHPFFREAIKQMGVRYPGVDLTLQEMPSSQQIEEIRKGALDAGFVYVARDAKERAISLPASKAIADLQSMLIDEGSIGIALPAGHPLGKSETLDLSDLSQEGFIIVGASLVNPYFPFAPKIVQQVSNIATQINLISVGMGVGLVLTSPRLRYPDDIRVVPLRNISYRSEFRLVWQSSETKPLLGNFVNVVRGLVGAS